MKNNPKISVCIPVFGTENVLERCLLSVAEQDFDAFEVIVVNDASNTTDTKNRNVKKICNHVLKKHKIPYKYIEHRENLGLVETRRDAVLKARGEYIFCIDSDDYLNCPSALSVFYEYAQNSNADIVNSTAVVESENQNSVYRDRVKQQERIFLGELSDREILDGYILEHNHMSFLWGKLIRKSIFEKAFDHIPFTKCTLAEDVLVYFFIALFSKKYLGIGEKFYTYTIDSGITSKTKITTLERWEQICSAASVFCILGNFLSSEESDKEKISEEIKTSIKQKSNRYLKTTLEQLKNDTAPELHDEAYEMLCEYWGEDYLNFIASAGQIS